MDSITEAYCRDVHCKTNLSGQYDGFSRDGFFTIGALSKSNNAILDGNFIHHTVKDIIKAEPWNS